MTVLPLALPSPLPNLLRANWRAAVELETEAMTSVVAGREPQAEERRQLATHPSRALRVTISGFSQDEATELFMNVVAGAHRRTVMPLYSDQASTTATSTGQFINVDTTKYRFFVGGRVVIHEFDAAGHPTNEEYKTIVGISSTQLDLGIVAPDQLQFSHPAGAHVFPLLDVEVQLESSRGVLETDEGFEVQYEAIEAKGPSSLPFLEDGLPTGFPTYLGFPILTIDPDWSQEVSASALRAGQRFALGRGEVVATLGARPQVRYEGTLQGLSRADGWDIARFLESRAGRLRPYWLVSPQTLFELESINAAYVEVSAVGNLTDVNAFLDHVAIVTTNGTHTIRGISSVTDQGGGVWRIVFDSAISAPAPADIVIVTSAHFVRGQSDAHTESWTTDGVVSFRFEAADLLQEDDFEIAGVDPPAYDFGPIADVPDLYLWSAPTGNNWTDLDGGGLTPSDRCKVFPDIAQIENDVDFGFDARQGRDDNTLTEPYLERVGGTGFPKLARFSQQHLNAGLPTFYHFGVDVDVGFLLRNSQGKFWDDTDGMTIFIVGRFGGPGFAGAPQRHVVRTGVFEWAQDFTNEGTVKFFAVADASVPAADISSPGVFDSQLRIWAVRWDPGVSAEVFVNGGAALASAASPAASLSAVARDCKVVTYRGNTFGSGDGEPQNIDQNLDRQSMTNDLLIYRRALTDSEMDIVGFALAAKYAAYGLRWDVVV